MTWVHIDFFFNSEAYITILTQDEKFMFENLVRKIIKRTRLIVRRKFWLYEPQPNCFLALELRSRIFLPVIIYLCWLYRRQYRFIKYMGLHTTGGEFELDRGNGEGFLDIVNAFNEWYLFKKFDNKTNLAHILHCCLEPMTTSRAQEVNIYKQMLKGYDPEYKDYEEAINGIKRSDTAKKKPPTI